jgi:hypothetical protein
MREKAADWAGTEALASGGGGAYYARAVGLCCKPARTISRST